MTDRPVKHIHLVGINGAGLSAIARVLLEEGDQVSGSDLHLGGPAEALGRDGAVVFEGHDSRNVNGADLVVVSSAVPEENVEVQAARAAGIPVQRRPAFLHSMMEGKQGVAVAGTHGKTTTTGMITTILLDAGRDPSFIVGGVLVGPRTNARAGGGSLFVVEADEYEQTFLSLRPEVGVITNVEHDHPDCYPAFADCRSAFESFAGLIPDGGLLAVCADDPVAQAIGQEQATRKQVRFFGLTGRAEWRAEETRPNFAGGVDFLAVHGTETLGLVRLRVPGVHNASNAMAALAVSDFLGVPFGAAREALTGFRGVERRFEIKGKAGGVLVIDDYAHHPTEIRATLRAAKELFPEKRIWAVWQPHTYSRTRALLGEFAASFDDADRVLVLPIYAARESDTLDVTALDVVEAMDHSGVQTVSSLEDAVERLLNAVRPEDVVLTLGAGDGNLVGERLLTRLEGWIDAEEPRDDYGG